MRPRTTSASRDARGRDPRCSPIRPRDHPAARAGGLEGVGSRDPRVSDLWGGVPARECSAREVPGQQTRQRRLARQLLGAIVKSRMSPAQLRARAARLLKLAIAAESAQTERRIVWSVHPVGLVPDEWMARAIGCAPNAVRERRLRLELPPVPREAWSMTHRNGWVAWRSEWTDARVRAWLRTYLPKMVDMHRKVMESGPPRYVTAAHAFGVAR